MGQHLVGIVKSSKAILRIEFVDMFANSREGGSSQGEIEDEGE